MAENILSQLQNLLKGSSINDIVKQAESVLGKDGKEGSLKSLSKVLNMFKTMQGGKILGNLGKMAGLSSLMSAAAGFQNSPENTEAQENALDELDTMVALAIEDGVISEEEENMLSEKARNLGIDVETFLAEVREKCANS